MPPKGAKGEKRPKAAAKKTAKKKAPIAVPAQSEPAGLSSEDAAATPSATTPTSSAKKRERQRSPEDKVTRAMERKLGHVPLDIREPWEGNSYIFEA